MRRRRLGSQVNEGARQAWLAMERLGYSQASLREVIRTRTGLIIPSSMLVRHLYCDRRPSAAASESYRLVLGVSPFDWTKQAQGPIQLPANSAAKEK